MDITTAAGRLHVRTIGSGPPALLWHSMLVDCRQWSRITARLAQHRTLVLVDGPGHGRSGPPPCGTGLADCADAAAQVLTHLGLGAVDWVGNAWGGHVGLVLAARRPDLCRTLTAVAAPPTPLPPAQRRRIGRLVTAYRLLGAARPLRSAVATSLLSPATAATDPAAVALVTDAFAAAPRTGMHRVMTEMMLRRPDLTAEVSRIAAPTLLVAGAQDPIWSPARAAAAAAAMPRATAAGVDGAGHLPPLEAPDAFADLVLGLWDGGLPGVSAPAAPAPARAVHPSPRTSAGSS
ncbi:alpha/beta hydrolase [Pseudonocardia sp. KRD-184]|uniref:Alpha/beta hydrolase n=1 Tax=Pseudonocardia oceani TaxID=2792013 RepID=A0ABS6U5V4_9PSEU|nr:alpha/beta hydrolase [Pseudonocardia oceani]MBW0092358.1 alpha/beta hydrolase [Pseudonocardia oceani]MBW0097597.1 alpha/beta hydrolase [Pseudonocardia oceani]MBW0110277.1 alpha/beta hydrolase [Pseudonocardia oceani]MBW0124303.1 alpha/beta hydrolase [Pseudonocardia oceani]MBW0127595.1 alpha/beta hydrolase [Pseudonocardia oceani]